MSALKSAGSPKEPEELGQWGIMYADVLLPGGSWPERTLGMMKLCIGSASLKHDFSSFAKQGVLVARQDVRYFQMWCNA